MPDVELLGLIATGHPCEAVYEYFTEILNEQQCKRWESRSSHGYSSLQAIVCEHLQPACERLLYHFTTLYGYALWTERYDKLLDIVAVRGCIDGLKILMQQLERYLADITKVSLSFQEFMKWMEDSKFNGESDLFNTLNRTVLVKFSEGGPEAERKNYDQWLVIDYIRNSFASDGLKHYFESVSSEGK
ncbi:anaphase-promoting complex, cyclosome, subunit 4-domain-containing protein [Dichotomocladium elegans]|nr:anaphase-promoting complex, cyclosome, subunit 4-domain-containing protein [Dichotomocladium elegans]